MFSAQAILLALLAGGCGALIGGTQTFIITGFVGLLSYVLQHAGIDVTFLNDTVLNTFFLPAIIFNGAGFATAYASKNHKIRGVETARSLAFTNDARVILAGCVGGVLGYFVYALANGLGIDMDTGALSVFTVGVLGRVLYNKEQTYNKENLEYIKHPRMNVVFFQLLLAFIVSTAMSFFAYESKLYTIGFSVSAFSLIFALIDPAFPATHHITLVAGYAVMQTGSIIMGIIFGMIAQLICYVFGQIFNTDCGTHVDPPAVAIGILSFILFNFF